MAGREITLGPVDATMRAFAIHNRIHFYLLENLAPEAWLLTPPEARDAPWRRWPRIFTMCG
jgi:hypothetical protein